MLNSYKYRKTVVFCNNFLKGLKCELAEDRRFLAKFNLLLSLSHNATKWSDHRDTFNQHSCFTTLQLLEDVLRESLEECSARQSSLMHLSPRALYEALASMRKSQAMYIKTDPQPEESKL